MTWLFVLGGAVLTWILAEAWGWQAMLVVLGGVLGWLFSRSSRQANRIDQLEKSLREMAMLSAATPAQAEPSRPVVPPALTMDSPEALTSPPQAPAASAKAGYEAAEPVHSASHEWALPSAEDSAAAGSSRPSPTRPAAAPPAGSGSFTRWIGAIRDWFSVGNVPVKVGMLVLFAGVAALLKYAADAGWFSFPIEFRLTGIAIAAIAALLFGWRQRHARPAFGLSLQGGAIGLLVLTVFAAFRLYGLLPSAAAFALLILIVIGAGVLAVKQNAMALAVLGMLAGYLAPILISTGSGDHVALFSYYAILNLAVFAIAWMRPWRVLNLIGFGFTYAIGTIWGVLKYRPEQFASTEPFLILFFVIYLLVPILYARKREPTQRDAIDGSLLFGNPLIAFALQAGLLDGDRMGLAFSALALALVYAALAWTLLRRTTMRVLGEAHAILAVGFATLAVPLALSAGATACTFALEGAALVWLGLRQGRRLPRWIGLALQAWAAVAWVLSSPGDNAMPLLNGVAIGALLIAAAGFVSAGLLRRIQPNGALPLLLTGWGLLWWLIAWLREIDHWLPAAQQADGLLGVAALSALLAAFVWKRWQQPWFEWIAAAGLLIAIVLAIRQAELHQQPFADWGALAWLGYAVGGALALRWIAASRAAVLAQHGWLWAWTIALCLLLHGLAIDHQLASGWLRALGASPLLVLAWLSLRKPAVLAWPRHDRSDELLPSLVPLLVLALLWVFAWALLDAGASTPLPYLPLLNPLELMQIAVLLLMARLAAGPTLGAALGTRRWPLLATLGFIFITVATLRACHQWGGLAWDASLISTRLAQTSLTVVWSLLGMAAWIVGSRRGQRGLWMVGALLLGVVLIKLLLVDRHHLGNLYGIGSFIAYGLLCTVIGYLAPAPAASPNEETRA